MNGSIKNDALVKLSVKSQKIFISRSDAEFTQNHKKKSNANYISCSD